MATRRPAASPRLEKEPSPPDTAKPSDTTPAVPSDVIFKLLAFTFAMIFAPLGVYFGSVRFVFNGNATYAGATAALAANVVLVAYVIVAMREDQAEKAEAEGKRKLKKEE